VVTGDAHARVVLYMRLIKRFLLSAALAGVGCSSEDRISANLPPVDHDAQGSWTQKTATHIPGNQFVMSLTESSGVIAGTGSFAGEAGPFGTLAVSGSIRNDSLHLRIVFDYSPIFSALHPDTAQFDGVLTSKNEMNGALMRGGSSGPIQFARLAGE
jgi:hypothetical protein